MNTCKNCKHYEQWSEWLDFYKCDDLKDKFGICKNYDLVGVDDSIVTCDTSTKSIVTVADGCNGSFVNVGEDFGCVNFEDKENE